MRVTLLSHTPDALNLLLRTKGTRLGSKDDPAQWSAEKKREHLDYMRDTIKSSWEFCSYVFEIEGVSRNFTHQLVRTRSASYAQESQRTVDVRDHVLIEPTFTGSEMQMKAQRESWNEARERSMSAYTDMIDDGLPVQDARGVLPSSISTSIIAQFNLRTLSDMGKVRLCTRTIGEYQSAFRAMRDAVIEVHPWAAEFIEVHCVATGTCAFPRYGKTSCKFYDPRMDLTTLREEVKVKFWSAKELQVAVPIARDGKTM